MLRVAITGLGVLGWAGGIGLIVAWRGTRRDPRASEAGDRPRNRIGWATGRVMGSIAGAQVAGILVLGLGGRLLMRLLAATSSDDVQGRITDAEEVVGEVTVDGTISLVLFLGVLGGLVSAAVYAGIRAWLPERSLPAGLVLAGIGGGVFGRASGLVDPDNLDFALLTPRWLAVVLTTGLVLTFGLLAAVLIDRWAASWPQPARTWVGVASLLPVVPTALFFVPLAGVVAAITLTSVLGGARAPTLLADRVLRWAVVAAGAVGGGWTLLGAAEILTA